MYDKIDEGILSKVIEMTLEKMIKCCEHLTPTELQLAQYILKHKEQIQRLSIQELSNRTFVSKSAIHRFCKKVGLEGFNELKIKLMQDLTQKEKGESNIDVNFPFLSEDSHQQIADKLLDLYKTSIQDTYNSIDLKVLNQCVKLLHKAKYIDIYAHAHNINVAENFQDKMRILGRKVSCPKSIYEQRATAVTSNDTHVAIILSYSGKATFLPSIIELLYHRKVKVILIERAGNNVSYPHINHYLYISDRELLRNRISQFSSHIAMQYILDLLFSCIFRIDYDKNMNYLEEVVELIDDRNLDFDE